MPPWYPFGLTLVMDEFTSIVIHVYRLFILRLHVLFVVVDTLSWMIENWMENYFVWQCITWLLRSITMFKIAGMAVFCGMFQHSCWMWGIVCRGIVSTAWHCYGFRWCYVIATIVSTIMSDFFPLRGITNNVGFALGVGETTRAVYM